MPERTVETSSPAETHSLAAEILRELPGRTVFALHGELGSGKTCFVQGMARALGHDAIVTSPTFKIVNEYADADTRLCHIDLYRIDGPEQALASGIDEYLEADAITAVEWAERAADMMPPETVHLFFTTLDAPDRRRIVVRWRHEAEFSHRPRRHSR